MTTNRWRTGAEPTREDVLAEMGRELSKRRQVFPRWVVEGKLTQEQADQRIDRLQRAYDYVMEHWPRTQGELLQ